MAPDPSSRVTSHASLDDVEDLPTRPARAAVAFVGPDGPDCVTAALRWDGKVRFGIEPGAFGESGVPGRVALVVDDGLSWFELRGVWWRGSAVPDGEPGDGDGLAWLRLDVRGVTAWDYGRVHEEPAP